MGDGTTSVVLLAAEILRECKSFIEDGLHPRIVVKGLREVCVFHICNVAFSPSLPSLLSPPHLAPTSPPPKLFLFSVHSPVPLQSPNLKSSLLHVRALISGSYSKSVRAQHLTRNS